MMILYGCLYLKDVNETERVRDTKRKRARRQTSYRKGDIYYVYRRETETHEERDRLRLTDTD